MHGAFSLIVASHVIEHLEKSAVVSTLAGLRQLLAPGGALVVAVSNAQSNTGAYWAYDDFTHATLFTSGSLWYVLRAAGFTSVTLLDIDCTRELAWHKKFARRLLLAVYHANYRFWNHVTASATHAPSDMIFSYEIKALARP